MKKTMRFKSNSKMGLCVAVGVGLGAAAGVALGDVSRSLGLGVAFGIIIGALWSQNSGDER